MAGPTGLEPATSSVTGRRSNQLSYGPIQLAAVYGITPDTSSLGAGDGNRTRVSSLENWRSTIELHPQRANSSRSQLLVKPVTIFSKVDSTSHNRHTFRF